MCTSPLLLHYKLRKKRKHVAGQTDKAEIERELVHLRRDAVSKVIKHPLDAIVVVVYHVRCCFSSWYRSVDFCVLVGER